MRDLLLLQILAILLVAVAVAGSVAVGLVLTAGRPM